MKRIVGNEEHEGLERGRAMYPGRPNPPPSFGYRWTTHVPDWCHLPSLESRTVQAVVRSPTGQETYQQVVQYKVPLQPPRDVLRRHAELAAQATTDIARSWDAPPMSERELTEKARADQERLAEFERKAGGER